MLLRGIRGATTTEENTRSSLLAATRELLEALVSGNQFSSEDVAAAIFTTTPDLNAEFPAVAARQMGWKDVPLLCGHEMAVPHSLQKCVRVLLLINTDRSPQEIVHVYLKAASNLRSEQLE